jgi:hypothetical protein
MSLTAPQTVAPGPRILFASPCLPYRKTALADDNVDYFYYRNTFHQGIFQLRQMASWHPLHFLAQNLPVDAVVLENPSFAEFAREVEEGNYQVVAISFTVILARKVLEMVTWLREHHPAVEIVLGGYGTVIFEESYGIEQEIARQVDRICRGEGLGFMRAYLQERFGVTGEVPHRQELVPVKNSLFRTRFSLFDTLVVASTLGCGNGCSFCCTSAFYGHKRLQLVSATELYELVRAAARRHPRAQSAMIFEEDFLADRARVLEFMACMEKDEELRDRPLMLTVFASVRSISRYSISELVRSGIGTLFIGVESFSDETLDGEGLGKRRGQDIDQLFSRLHEAGIGTLASMILGWDGHTPENIEAEMEHFVSLSPTFYQVVPLHPAPGTRLWKRMREEGRIVKDYKYEEDGVARSNFTFKHFEAGAVHALTSRLYGRLVQEGGPWPFRAFRVYVAGWRALSRSDEPALAARGRACRKLAFTVLPLAIACRWMFFGQGFRRAWRASVAGFAREFPVRTAAWLLASPLVAAALVLLRLFGAARQGLSRDGDQPERLRRAYAGSVYRLLSR